MSDSAPIQGVTSRTVKSSAWMYGRMLVTNVINLGVMAILARQLTPADFGLVALAQVLLRFLAVIGASGVGEYIIYDNAEGREERTHAAFWLGMAMAMVVVTLGLIAMPVLTRFYTDEGLGVLLLLMLIRYPLDQISTVPDAIIKKSLDYKKLVIRDTVLEIVTSLASVVMALSGFGVFSLVIPSLAAAPLRAVIVMWMSKWHPTLPLRFPLWKGIFKYSANVIGGTFATSVIAEGDTIVIGKSLGSNQLGLYNLSWQSANIVPRTVTGVIGKLAMPAFSAVSLNRNRLIDGYRKVIQLLSTVSFPLVIGLMSISDLFILVIYGSQWKESILPFQILLIGALSRSIGSPVSVIPNVLGKPEIYTKISLSFIPIYLSFILIGSKFSIIGVAIGVSTSRLLYDLTLLVIGSRMIKIKAKQVISAIFKPLFLASIMGLIVSLVKLFIGSVYINDLLEILLLVTLGGVIYLVMIRIFCQDNLFLLIDLIRDLSPKSAKMIYKFLFLQKNQEI